MSVTAVDSLSRHDPTNPHPVSVVSGWNPAEECPELTRISPGLSGITQAGEGLRMIASLGWGVYGVGGMYISLYACELGGDRVSSCEIYVLVFVDMCSKCTTLRGLKSLKNMMMCFDFHIFISVQRGVEVSGNQIFQDTDTFWY